MHNKMKRQCWAYVRAYGRVLPSHLPTWMEALVGAASGSVRHDMGQGRIKGVSWRLSCREPEALRYSRNSSAHIVKEEAIL